jgi:hypothetical protein
MYFNLKNLLDEPVFFLNILYSNRRPFKSKCKFRKQEEVCWGQINVVGSLWINTDLFPRKTSGREASCSWKSCGEETSNVFAQVPVACFALFLVDTVRSTGRFPDSLLDLY